MYDENFDKKYTKEFKTWDADRFLPINSKRKKEKIHNLENKIKFLETKLYNDENIKLYNKHTQELMYFLMQLTEFKFEVDTYGTKKEKK